MMKHRETNIRFPWLYRFEGIGLLLTLMVLLLGLGAHLVPDDVPFLATNLRMIDSLRPHFLALAAVGGIGLARLNLRYIGIFCAVAAGLGWGALLFDYQSRSVSVNKAAAPSLTLIWFNLLQKNSIAPDLLEAELRKADADIAVLSEARAARPIMTSLKNLYPYQAGCSSDQSCELLILSQQPIEDLLLTKTASGPDRFARFRLLVPGKEDLWVVAMHRVKPWYLGMTGREQSWIDVVLGRASSQPLVVMGDFNAAPWSRGMQMLERNYGLGHPPRPIATWPQSLGGFGLPIDHILLRGNIELQEITPWGNSLGSNHRGLLAHLHVPAELDQPAEGS